MQRTGQPGAMPVDAGYARGRVSEVAVTARLRGLTTPVLGAPRSLSSAPTSTRSACASLSKGEVPDPRGGPARARRPRAWRPAGCAFVVGAANARRAAPSSCSSACRRRRATTARPTSRTSRRWPARSRRCCAPGTVVDQQVDDAGRLDPRSCSAILAEAGAPPTTSRVASNPEFLREGTAVRDFLDAEPRRHRVRRHRGRGARVASCTATCSAPMLVTDPASAEMIKYASNAFLATKISFINAIANLCEAVDADVREVALGMGYDQRIGFEFLHPGPGYGGSCFPKDTAALLHTADDAGYDFGLLARRGRGQPARSTSAWSTRSRAAAGGDRSTGVARRRVGAHVQGQHRRPARLARARDRAAGCSRRARRCGPTTPRPGERPRRCCPGSRSCADPYEACDGRRRARAAHRVGRVPLARLRPGASTRWPQPRGRRRPQPARPGGDAPARLRVPGRRALMPRTRRRHRRRRLPRLAPLRRAASRAAGEVVAVDNLLTGRPRERRATSPTTRLHVRRARRDRTASRSTGAVDAVLHFASPASPPEYLAHPIETLEVGSLGTRHALELARAQRRALPARVDERDLRRPARAPAARELLGQREPASGRARCTTRPSASPRRSRWRTTASYGVDTEIVRIFNTYGPRLRPADGRVVSNFLVQAIDGEPLTVYGDGKQTRSFCYVDDEVARAPRAARLRPRRTR